MNSIGQAAALKVMLVDDDPERVRTVQLALALARAGCEVVAHRESAIDLHRSVSEIKPDVIIIDVAIARFEQFQALRRELLESEEKLAERKVIERAKGILMQGRNLSEDEAYRALRQQAMGSNARLGDVARQVIALAGLLSG